MSIAADQLNALIARLECVADRLEGSPSTTSGASAPTGGSSDPAIVTAFDEFVKSKGEPIEAAATALGNADISESTTFFMEQLRNLRSILVATGRCRKPKDDEWGKFFGPVSELSQKAGKACDNRSEFFSNRKAVSEALAFIMMVTMPNPGAGVQNALESMDFHAIKVLQKKNPPETAWINALKTCLKELVEWCKENCKMGLDWKVGGEDPIPYFEACPVGSAPSASAAAPKAGGKGKGKGGPPPVPKGGFKPPPPMEERFGSDAGKPKAAGAGMAGVFDAINNFSTGGLKKVTDDMKCKNMKDVAVKEPQKAKAAPKAAGRRSTLGPKGAPRKELEKEINWIIENFEGETITLDDVTMKQSICVINCKNTTIRLGNKVKSVSVDGCERVAVVTKDVLSVVELVNSDRCQIQADGKVLMVSVDKCNGFGLWLNKESIECEIVTSKSSEMNVTIPDDQGDEMDTIELPIPEQFVTKIAGRKCKTEVSSLYSS